jgi:hypothetical protein
MIEQFKMKHTTLQPYKLNFLLFRLFLIFRIFIEEDTQQRILQIKKKYFLLTKILKDF